MYRIKFGELRLGEIAKNNLLHVVETNWASGGPKVREFENKWSKLFDYPFSRATSSGTDADINACMMLYDFGAQRGDEIIVPALSFIASANSILAAGFKPVFVDIEKETLNINPHLIEEKITDKTRAIMVVHTMGKPCDMDTVCDMAKGYNLFLIEDACEAHGAMYKGNYVGKFGEVATFSFYVAHLICCGEGGMVSTSREDIAKIILSTRNHGRKEDSIYFDHIRFALNSKMNDLEASLGLEGVKNFWQTFGKRKQNLEYLLNRCKDLQEYAWFNQQENYEICCPHAFSVTLKDPQFDYKNLYRYLEDRGIMCKRNFGSSPTQHKAFAFMGHQLGEFPNAEYVGDNGLHFGIHQYLSESDLTYAVEVLHDYFKGKQKRI